MNPNELATFGFAAVCCVSIALWARAGLAELGKRMFDEISELRGNVQKLSEARAQSQEKHTRDLLEQERRHGTNMDNIIGMCRNMARKPCVRSAAAGSDMDSDAFRNETTAIGKPREPGEVTR